MKTSWLIREREREREQRGGGEGETAKNETTGERVEEKIAPESRSVNNPGLRNTRPWASFVYSVMEVMMTAIMMRLLQQQQQRQQQRGKIVARKKLFNIATTWANFFGERNVTK